MAEEATTENENSPVDSDADSFDVHMDAEDNPTKIEPDSQSSSQSVDSTPDREEFGKRAQKRIRNLVSKQKEAEQYLAAQQAELERLQDENDHLRQSTTVTQHQNIDAQLQRVLAQRSAAEQDYRIARANEDSAKEMEAIKRISQAETAGMALQAQKNRMGPPQQGRQAPQGQQAPQDHQQQQQMRQPPPPQDERTEKWIEKNQWVTSLQDPSAPEEDKEMAMHAGRLHNYATQVRQLDPIQDADEYWSEIDEGMKREFPQRFAGNNAGEAEESNRPAPRSAVAGARRPSRSKRKVKLSEKQMDFARRYGVKPEDMARQQALLDAQKDS